VVVSASVTSASLPAGQSRTFAASASDADNQTLTYRWVFGDGSTSTKASAAKTFSTRGSFTATLTVTDAGALTAVRTVAYSVT
jgi:PKD repeat protein